MLERLNDTIVAVSSAPGHGTVGIVRLSGPEALTIADRMAATATNESLTARPASTRIAGEVFLDPDRSLPATFYVFREPRSYTRQDLVEVHTIGSPPVLEVVRLRAIELGAIAAQPGEFTARAFLNGAMDLAVAEAVAGVIRAQTDTQLRASRRMMDGALAARITAARDQLAEILGLVEADIDFSEEPIDFITPSALRIRLDNVGVSLQRLLQEAVSAERFQVLPHILLFGPPNSGKSSLMNRLSGTSRSICAAAAGTTRDVLSAPIRLRRGEAILLDTAGVDPSEDEIVAAAHARTMSTAEQVDLVCVVVDLAKPDGERVFEAVRSLNTGAFVVAANKCDIVPSDCTEACIRLFENLDIGRVVPVSALTGAGIDTLRNVFADALESSATTTLAESVLISERQRSAVDEARDALQRAHALITGVRETVDCAELVAFEIREAMDALGTVTGQVTTEDLLNRVFADFCIGK